ncbi:hypothetical protein ABIC52_001618 [Curtobacterium oceanosedimentum]
MALITGLGADSRLMGNHRAGVLPKVQRAAITLD